MTNKILSFQISPKGDLEVKSTYKGHEQAIYTLKREIMVAKSQYFKNHLRYTHLGDQSSPGITLEDDDPEALNIWFRHFHAEGDAERKELQQPDQLSDISVKTIWHLACVGDKYDFDGEVLGGFLKKWYRHHVRLSNNNSNDDEEFPYNFVAYVKTLPFPCLVFDHAEGFAETTKWLAYNSIGHIREVRPPGFTSKYHHLSPKDFVGPLNAARGRLKTILGQGLCNASDDILTRGRYGCTCKQYRAVVGQYLEELSRVRVYPLEKSVLSNSIARMLKLLDEFKLDPAEACSFCTKRWDLTVQSAVERVNGYFDGLCLDCMDRSNYNRKDAEEDYWKKSMAVNGKWDENCRIKHGEPTWYHSWCGRDEHRQKLMDMRRVDMDPRRFYPNYSPDGSSDGSSDDSS